MDAARGHEPGAPQLCRGFPWRGRRHHGSGRCGAGCRLTGACSGRCALCEQLAGSCPAPICAGDQCGGAIQPSLRAQPEGRFRGKHHPSGLTPHGPSGLLSCHPYVASLSSWTQSILQGTSNRCICEAVTRSGNTKARVAALNHEPSLCRQSRKVPQSPVGCLFCMSC